jgi:hypothetical protein
MVDVGPKEGTEAKIAGKEHNPHPVHIPQIDETKIIEYLQTYMRFPQTLRLFLGAGPGSPSALNSLAQERLLSKLVLLSGDSDAPASLATLRLPALRVSGLFARTQEPRTPTSPVSPPQRTAPMIFHSETCTPTTPESVASSGYSFAGLSSPQSPMISMLPPPAGPRVIDPSKVSICYPGCAGTILMTHDSVSASSSS